MIMHPASCSHFYRTQVQSISAVVPRILISLYPHFLISSFCYKFRHFSGAKFSGLKLRWFKKNDKWDDNDGNMNEDIDDDDDDGGR